MSIRKVEKFQNCAIFDSNKTNNLESESDINGEATKQNNPRRESGLFSQYKGREANDIGYQTNDEG